MNDFVTAMTSHDAKTTNGATMHSTAGPSTIDLFFQIGAVRGREENLIEQMFTKALGEDPLTAMKILFYNRDVRGGQGERRSFRVIARYLAQMHPALMRKNLHLVPEYGRWDDLLTFVGTDLESDAFALIRTALLEGNGLCAKWMPREKSAKKALAFKLRKYLDMNSKAYRKMLSRLTKVVETQMCEGNWEDINYSHVPSVAMKSYRKAFARHSPDRWDKYMTAIESGDTSVKINASAIFPHDIVKQWVGYGGSHPTHNEVRAADAQWKALTDYMGENSGKVLAMADVSGSMYHGANPSLAPIQASVSLALYIAERGKGAFNNFYMSFSSEPAFIQVKGANIYEKIRNINSTNVGYSTDINKAFRVLLQRATSHSVSQENMPETLLIISDMQFNSGNIGGKTNLEVMREQYRAAGYIMPNIVFWNVNAQGGAPAKSDEQGVALVSGYSPSVLKAILGGEMSPVAVMDRAINSGRYDVVSI
jgi:hypothetical protein